MGITSSTDNTDDPGTPDDSEESEDAENPRTGDDNSLGTWLTLLLGSIMGLCGAGFRRMRRKKEN